MVVEAVRTPSDFRWIVKAIEIHSQVRCIVISGNMDATLCNARKHDAHAQHGKTVAAALRIAQCLLQAICVKCTLAD